MGKKSKLYEAHEKYTILFIEFYFGIFFSLTRSRFPLNFARSFSFILLCVTWCLTISFFVELLFVVKLCRIEQMQVHFLLLFIYFSNKQRILCIYLFVMLMCEGGILGKDLRIAYRKPYFRFYFKQMKAVQICSIMLIILYMTCQLCECIISMDIIHILLRPIKYELRRVSSR